MNFVASAPGKIFVSGEYAVLAGAPALVMAINRRVICSVRDAPTGGWCFQSRGFAADMRHTLASLTGEPSLPRSDPAHLCQHVLRQMRMSGIALDTLPPNLSVEIDSSAGFDGARKLGIGTSAAVCSALTSALLAMQKGGQSGSDPRSAREVFPIALAAHRAAQRGRGSGADVAASCFGGLVRFEAQPPRATRVAFPRGVSFAAIFAGHSADTREHVVRFDQWRGERTPEPLQALRDAASRVSDALPEPTRFMQQLRAYAATLASLDDAAVLGIYSAPHRLLSDLAAGFGVVYKPCGAGGGDLGMAFVLEEDARALESFVQAAHTAGFTRLPLELDEHGITVGIDR